MMDALSVCSGIGGLDYGLEQAGIRVRGQVEIDPWCRSILARHWPDVPQHDDLRTAADWWLSKERPEIDLICGGIPCQPHSVAGKRLGTADSRWIWPWAAELIEATAVRWVLLENVPRIRTSGLVSILEDLACLGFDAVWSRIPAAALGAPHLRWRLILIAARGHTLPDIGEWPGFAVRGWEGSSWILADPASARCQSSGTWPPDGEIRDGRRRELEPAGLRSRGQQDVWPPESGMDRLADGIPGQVDRLRGLGNAVVPAVGKYAGELLMRAAKG
jgi:DNA (cytosine-5)-methyltransferase 1